jgi:site-specific DNA recombinase
MVRVWVAEWSRWARDTSYGLDMLQKLEAAGVEVFQLSTGQAVTQTTPEGFLAVGIESVVAQHYSVNLSRKQRLSYEHRRSKQRPMGGPKIWGYERDMEQGQYVPSADWAFCRTVIERYIGGAYLTDVVRWLWTEHGVKKSSAGLRMWLTNPVLRGHLAYHGRSELRYDCHPAMLSESEYQLVLSRLALNRQLRGKNKGKVYAVPTIVFCARCGERCSTCSNRLTRYFYCYRAVKRGDCNAPKKYTREDWIEAAIQNAITDAAESVAHELITESSDPRIPAWEAEITALQGMAHRPAIAAEIDSIRAEIAQAKAAQGNQAAGGAEYWEQVELLARFTPEDWAAMPAADRRQTYAYLVRRVTVEGGEVVEVELGR